MEAKPDNLCCIEGCYCEAVVRDCFDNPFCEECALQNQNEEPENWEDD